MLKDLMNKFNYILLVKSLGIGVLVYLTAITLGKTAYSTIQYIHNLIQRKKTVLIRIIPQNSCEIIKIEQLLNYMKSYAGQDGLTVNIYQSDRTTGIDQGNARDGALFTISKSYDVNGELSLVTFIQVDLDR